MSNHSPSKIRQVVTPSFEELKHRAYLNEFTFYTENKVHKIEIIVRDINTIPELSPEEKLFVDDIMHQLGDHSNSRHYYEKVCRTVDRNLIYRALSEVKEEQTFGEIKKQGSTFHNKNQEISERDGNLGTDDQIGRTQHNSHGNITYPYFQFIFSIKVYVHFYRNEISSV